MGRAEPPGFLFAVKMSRYITHIRRLGGLETGIPLFYERIAPLAASPKLGPVLRQLPPTFRRNDDSLAAALAALPAGRHAFEFRHPTWYSAESRLLPEAGMPPSIPDIRSTRSGARADADWTFVLPQDSGRAATTRSRDRRVGGADRRLA